MSLIDSKEAVKLLEKIVGENKDNFGSPDRILNHFYAVGERAKDVSNKLEGLDSHELEIAGYFHDIGRCFAKDLKEHAFHEIIGARYIEENAVKLEITDSQEQANRIAQSIRSHFVVSEQFKMKEYDEFKPGLLDTSPYLLVPVSWNELVIGYSDLTIVGGKVVSFGERINDIKKRDKENKSYRLKALEKAESRLTTYKNHLEDVLSEGKVNGDYKILK